MILGMEIALAIIGLLALVRGKMTISGKKVVVGVPARLLGLLALSAVPLVFAVGILYVVVEAPNDPEQFAEDNKMVIFAIEAGVVIGVAILVFGLGAALAISPEEAERRERGTAYED